jgi:hypothetical protein
VDHLKSVNDEPPRRRAVASPSGATQRASRLSGILFLAAVGLIAVHVIDDSFVQPHRARRPATMRSVG